MDRVLYRLYLYACAQRRLRDAAALGLPGPEAVQSVVRYLRGMYPLEIDEWALLAMALVASIYPEAALNEAEPTSENPRD